MMWSYVMILILRQAVRWGPEPACHGFPVEKRSGKSSMRNGSSFGRVHTSFDVREAPPPAQGIEARVQAHPTQHRGMAVHRACQRLTTLVEITQRRMDDGLFVRDAVTLATPGLEPLDLA